MVQAFSSSEFNSMLMMQRIKSNCNLCHFRLAKYLHNLHQNMWKSGHYLLLICSVTVFLCFLPIISPFGNVGIVQNPKTRQLLLDGMSSIEWKFAIFGSICLSIFMVVEFVLDAVNHVRDRCLNKIKAPMPRFSLLCSILIPNLLLLLVSIPMEWIELTTCLFMIRNNMMFYTIVGYIWIAGGTNSQPFLFIGADIIGSLCMVLLCWDYNSAYGGSYLFWIGSAFGVIAAALLLIMSWKLWLQLWKSGLKHLSTDQISCFGYLSIFGAYGIALVLINLLFMGNHNILCLCLYTYAEAAFTMAMYVFEVRLTRYQLVLTQIELRESEKKYMRYISHEMRTPLNIVIIGLKVMERDLKDGSLGQEEALKSVEEIQAAAGVVMSVLNDLLLLDKVKQGTLMLDLEDVDPFSIIKNTVQVFNIQAREAKVRLEIECEQAMQDVLSNHVIRADQSKLAQVIRNLASNAIKFTPAEGSVTVCVEAVLASNASSVGHTVMGVRPEHGGPEIARGVEQPADVRTTDYSLLRVSVTDTGAGISQENQGKLFTQEIQFSPGKLQKGGGSGLGLYRIVDSHQGKLSVYSQGEGTGSVFTLEIPLFRKPKSTTVAVTTAVATATIATTTTTTTATIATTTTTTAATTSGTSQVNDSVQRFSFKEQRSSEGAREGVMAPVGAWNLRSAREEKGDDDPIAVSVNAHSVARGRRGRTMSLFANKKALLVDDVQMNRKMLRRLLAPAGVACTEAEDGLDAIEKYQDVINAGVTFDLVMMDFQMPNMDGPTAIRSLRELGYKGVIAGVTGNVVAEDKNTMMSAGADTVMEKPFDMDLFCAWYKSHLENCRGRDHTASTAIVATLPVRVKPKHSAER